MSCNKISSKYWSNWFPKHGNHFTLSPIINCTQQNSDTANAVCVGVYVRYRVATL